MSPDFSTRPSPAEPGTSVRAACWRKTLVWAIFGLWTSGVAWLAARFLFASETDFGLQVPEWAAKVLAVHGGAAMLSLVAFGAWLPVHVVPRLRQQCHRLTGFTQLGLLAILAVTGFGLYYVAGEDSRPAWSVIHWAAGLILPAVFLIHRRAVAGRIG